MLNQIHDVTVRTVTGTVTDPEGRTTPTVADRLVRGSVDQSSLQGGGEKQVAEQYGQQVDVVARLPLTDPVTDRDQLVVTEPAGLAGVYRIASIRANRLHKRVLCLRLTVEDV